MEDKHQAGYIRKLCEDVINHYEIPPQKIVRIVTDSAANMKAAFINPFGSFMDEEVERQENSAIPDSVCTLDEFTQYAELYSNNRDTEDTNPSVPSPDFGHTKPHIRCAAHRLQLVLKDVMEKDAMALSIKKSVFTILGKFMKSHNATRDLYLRCGKKLLFPATTRWSSLHITYERFLDVSEQKITAICQLLSPFRGFTNKLQSDNIPTISLLYPGIRELIRALERSDNMFGHLKEQLIQSLEQRFSDVLNSGSTSDPIFLISAFLDPSVSVILRTTDELEFLAKVEMKNMCAVFSTSDFHNEHPNETSVESLLGFSVETTAQTQRSTLETEISAFFEDRVRPSFRSSSAAIYWSMNKKTFPTLAILADQLFCVPATSASVERLFSQTTLNTCGHRSGTGPETTTAKVFINFNKKYII